MRATMRILDEDSTETVTLFHVKEACEQMILARETHLDALAYRMEDKRIRRLMETLVAGNFDLELAESEGFRICLDLGLVRMNRGTPEIANPIYREVLARQMTYGAQSMILEPEWKWEKDDGSLDMETLLKEFQKFWRKHSEIWEQKSDYTEAFPHLLIMAFLQRVLNGGGNIQREYAAGRGRMDLAVEYKDKFFIIEIKLIHSHDSKDEVTEEGLAQITKYRNSIDSSAPSYLVIFDRRPESKAKSWDEKLYWFIENEITVVGC